jgi:hypothetical protein
LSPKPKAISGIRRAARAFSRPHHVTVSHSVHVPTVSHDENCIASGLFDSLDRHRLASSIRSTAEPRLADQRRCEARGEPADTGIDEKREFSPGSGHQPACHRDFVRG